MVARPRKFDDEDLLDAALATVALEGSGASIAAIAARLDAPVGSIYHRVAGRDELLGRLWLREIERFQAELLPHLEIDDAESAIESGVRRIATWCDEHPAEARALTLFRQERLVARVDGELRDRALHVNDEIAHAVRRLARRRYGAANRARLRLIQAAVLQVPYDMVRPYLGDRIPDWLPDAAVAAARSVAARGDRVD